MSEAPLRKVLITGSMGFVGSRLVPFLRERGREVVAGAFDILDFAATESAIRSAAPDVVIHLAAIGHIPTCEADPAQAFRTNLAGTAGLLEALRRSAPAARLVFASTAQVYAVPTSQPLQQPFVITETCNIAPQNMYALTKWSAELLIEDACRRGSLRATVLRLFNHTHRTQSPDFFLPHVYKAISDSMGSRRGERLDVPVGALQVSRDIGAVQDLVAAFGLLLDRPDSGPPHEVFNVCSGVAKNLSALAVGLAERLGVDVRFVVDPGRIRPGEPQIVRGSHDRFTQATAWQPRYTNENELLDAFLSN